MVPVVGEGGDEVLLVELPFHLSKGDEKREEEEEEEGEKTNFSKKK